MKIEKMSPSMRMVTITEVKNTLYDGFEWPSIFNLSWKDLVRDLQWSDDITVEDRQLLIGFILSWCRLSRMETGDREELILLLHEAKRQTIDKMNEDSGIFNEDVR